jgi:hypothetical protein
MEKSVEELFHGERGAPQNGKRCSSDTPCRFKEHLVPLAKVAVVAFFQAM